MNFELGEILGSNKCLVIFGVSDASNGPGDQNDLDQQQGNLETAEPHKLSI